MSSSDVRYEGVRAFQINNLSICINVSSLSNINFSVHSCGNLFPVPVTSFYSLKSCVGQSLAKSKAEAHQ